MKKIAFYTVAIMIWELVYRLGVEIPSPFGVAKSLVDLMKSGELFDSVFTSVKRLFIGYAISLVIGITLGLLISNFKVLDNNLSPLLLGLQTLPSVCWMPFALLWFGEDQSSIVFIVAAGSTFAVTIAIHSAIRNVHPLYTKAASTMGASGVRLYFGVTLPAALPSMIGGLKQGWAFAWRALIAGEMIIVGTGLGRIIIEGNELEDMNIVVATMIVIIVIGLILDKVLFDRLEKSIRQKWGLERV